jgi:SAM-dependent methyltransferase
MDIGCGNGCLLHLARREGWHVTGMELSAAAAHAIQDDQGIDVKVANFLEYDNDDGDEFDVVVLRHVLEHLPDSVLAMNRIGKLMKDNGLALLEFPNTRSFSYTTKRFLKNRGWRNRKYSREWRPGHCNEFCRRSFEFLLQKTGFELLVWQTYSTKTVANALYRLFPIASKARALVRKLPATKAVHA